MKAKFKDIVVEGDPTDVYIFYTFYKFNKHFEKELKKQIKEQQEQEIRDFDKLFNEIKNRFEED